MAALFRRQEIQLSISACFIFPVLFSMLVHINMVKLIGFNDTLFQSKMSQSLYLEYSSIVLYVELKLIL